MQSTNTMLLSYSLLQWLLQWNHPKPQEDNDNDTEYNTLLEEEQRSTTEEDEGTITGHRSYNTSLFTN